MDKLSCVPLPLSEISFLYNFTKYMILVLDKIQSPTRPYMNWPLPTSLASPAATAFLSVPCISLLSLLFLKHVKVLLLFPLVECPSTIITEI